MKVKECKSSNDKCPCMHCEKYCCVDCGVITDTEKLCEVAREYCKTLHRGKKMTRDEWFDNEYEEEDDEDEYYD